MTPLMTQYITLCKKIQISTILNKLKLIRMFQTLIVIRKCVYIFICINMCRQLLSQIRWVLIWTNEFTTYSYKYLNWNYHIKSNFRNYFAHNPNIFYNIVQFWRPLSEKLQQWTVCLSIVRRQTACRAVRAFYDKWYSTGEPFAHTLFYNYYSLRSYIYYVHTWHMIITQQPTYLRWRNPQIQTI